MGSNAPRTVEEHAIARIWAELLNLPDVGVHDDPFDLGADSLIATQVVARIRDRFGLEMPIPVVLESTVAELAARIASPPSPAAK